MMKRYANRRSIANSRAGSAGPEILDGTAIGLAVDDPASELTASSDGFLLGGIGGDIAEGAQPRMTSHEHVHRPSSRSPNLIRAVGDRKTLVRRGDQKNAA